MKLSIFEIFYSHFGGDATMVAEIWRQRRQGPWSTLWVDWGGGPHIGYGPQLNTFDRVHDIC